MAARGMTKILPEHDPSTTPQYGSVGVEGEQLRLLFGDSRIVAEAKSPGQRGKDIYAELEAAVEEHEGGKVAFAVKMNRSVSDTSRRLRRVDDDHGEQQRAFLDFLGFLGIDGRERFLAGLCARWGYLKPEPIRGLSAGEKLRVLAGELTDKRRRQLEREHGLPAGSLDP